MKVRPDRTPAAWPTLKTGGDAIRWLRLQADLAKEFLAARTLQPVPATIYDGGQLVEAALKTLDNVAWQEFERTFVTLPSKS
jgi:hypothetical protein